MKIDTTFIAPGCWQAVDEDSFDGAPDAKAPSNISGFGKTEREAINNLVEQLVEHEREYA